MEKLSFIKLKEISDEKSITDAIEFAKSFYLDYPNRPKKPILNQKNTTSIQAKEYAEKLELWEIEMATYDIELSAWLNRKEYVNGIVIDLIKEKAGINIVPEKYREKVWSKAWSDGHSSGFYEVYLKLNSLIEIFE